MSIDVNKITSTLAKLKDPQLQQYAQMHKNDPYIMALAMSESNRRKEVRAAEQGDMQEQPKVVDQMLAEMAPRPPQPMPEDQGIGQLPAGNMNFAGGGIIAFADGGDVERFNGSQSQFVQDIMGIPQQYTEYQQRIRESDRIKAEREKEMEQRRQDELAARQKTSFANYLFGSPEREAAGKAELAQLATTPVGAPARSGTMPEPGYTRPGMLYDPRLNTPPTQPVVAAPKADTTKRSLSGAPATQPTAPAAADKDIFGLESLQATQKKLRGNDDYEIGALRNQLVEIKNRAETQAQSALDARKTELTAEGDVYKDRSDRLVERATRLKGQEGKNTGLALLNAGLAIMSTPGSLATAIGKGAQVGTAQYAAGIKDLRAAQERLDEANDRISDLRLNRKDMNAKEIRSLERERDAALRDGEKMVFGFAEKVYGLKRKDADSLFTSYMSGQEKKAELTSRETTARLDREAANARSNAPTSEMREAMLLGTGNTPEEKYLSGLKVKKELAGDRQGTQLLKLFLEENGRREKNMEKPLTLDQFRRTSAAFYAPPAAVDTSKPTRP